MALSDSAPLSPNVTFILASSFVSLFYLPRIVENISLRSPVIFMFCWIVYGGDEPLPNKLQWTLLSSFWIFMNVPSLCKLFLLNSFCLFLFP